DLYRGAADRLLTEGKAYRAFETPEELDAMKTIAGAAGGAFRYDGRARSIPKEESDRRAAAGEKFVLRLRVPDETLVVDDVVQGRTEFPAGALDDFVLVRSDGHALYHFTVCVDDVAMGITHVIRGVDHLPNAPKHVALFRALGVSPPVFAHLGMILGADGRKLSKRHGAAGVEEFEAQGYLPAALDNFLALLGWSPGEDRERMTLAEMAGLFSLERIGPSPSRFDHEKLAWMNGQYLQEIPAERLIEMLKPFRVPDRDPEILARAIALHRSRARTLVELAHALAIYGDDPTDFDPVGTRKFGKPDAAPLVRALAERLSATDPFSHAALEEAARTLAAEKGLKLGDLAQPARLALTGVLASPPLFEMIEVLGNEATRRRLLAFADRIAKRTPEPGASSSAVPSEGS
ncbi:MAG: glutamate--tRNA ligase, partial [Thermoanaerobaculia bacterium]|nr:glutamate--tRNA ligase [Thermoanaerobaculia bacterium]